MSNVILEKVSRDFGEFVAVDGVDLRVNEGEFVTLLGPSGCGKTTTLRMVAGLEQNTGGRISIGNEVVSDAARGIFVPSERRRLGMVFQSYAIWPHMTGLRQRRLSAAGSPPAGSRNPRARHEGAAARRDGRVCRAAGAGAVRRPAAAGGDRARAGVRAEGAAARRAAQQPRREAPLCRWATSSARSRSGWA